MNIDASEDVFSASIKPFHNHLHTYRGENVEEAFLETAKKIYQNIQDGRYVRDAQGFNEGYSNFHNLQSGCSF